MDGTLLLTGKDVAELLSLEDCMTAVENAFRLYAEGKASPPKVVGLHSDKGGFHIKAGILNLKRNYFVVKINSNFPGNRKQYDLPLIQGVLAVYDGENGRLLSLMDSIEITIIRTGAATGVAAKYLAKKYSKIATIIGAGNQGRISLKAMMQARQLEKAFVYDMDKGQAINFAKDMSRELKVSVNVVDDFREAAHQSDICVTCTTSTRSFLGSEDIRQGTFIAAVGADNEHKQELYPELLLCSKLITDLTEQCSTIGELHHALDANLLTIENVHAELGEVIAGTKPGRVCDDEIIIFDSTGTALQDVAAAAIVYEKAVENNIGSKLNFSETLTSSNSEALRKNEKNSKALRWWFPFK